MLILKLVITFSGYILSKNQLKFKTEEHYTLKNTISVVKTLINLIIFILLEYLK